MLGYFIYEREYLKDNNFSTECFENISVPEINFSDINKDNQGFG